MTVRAMPERPDVVVAGCGATAPTSSGRGRRTDAKTTSFSDSRKYIGQQYDDATNLSYLNARYYDSARGHTGIHDNPYETGTPQRNTEQ